jgi:hypothetical protein
MLPILKGMGFLMEDGADFKEKVTHLGQSLSSDEVQLVVKLAQNEAMRLVLNVKRPR